MAGRDVRARGRAAFEAERWSEAFHLLTDADSTTPLDPDDLDRLATAAFLIGEDRACEEARRRAHMSYLAKGDVLSAARSAFWLAFAAMEKPDQQAVGGGWLSRVARLLEQCPPDCAVRGFWLCATALQKIGSGDMAGGKADFLEAARIGAASGDRDLMALARQAEGRMLLGGQRTAEGLAIFDEVMVSVTCGEVSPMVSGVVYCSVISACHDAFDLRRAQEWTDALSDWCSRHPDMVPFRVPCLVRRSELLQLQGEWPASLDEASRACSRSAGESDPDAGLAYYQLAELRRLRGEFAESEQSYHRASLGGRRPQPGLALLRLAQGQVPDAVAAIRLAQEAPGGSRRHADVLRAAVTIFIAGGDVDAAAHAAEQLRLLAGVSGATLLRALASSAAGAVALAQNEIDVALRALRDAWTLWRDLHAPYDIATTGAMIADAYLARGDADGARMEWEAAQEIFERLGAVPDAERIAARLSPFNATDARGRSAGESDRLTGREVEVLRLIATGRSNRAIGGELRISEKTVARHISNIFTKLDLSSRAAATAWAYEHKLV